MRRLFLAAGLLSYICHTQAMMAHRVDVEKGIHQAISQYGIKTEPTLKSYFAKAHVAYPPKRIALLAFKKERQVQLWAKNNDHGWRHIHNYPLTATSGRLGPKLKEHDKQIPEGIYRLTSLNPYSAWHLSMMINYPNEFDRYQASRDRRYKLGGNIFIHGKSRSVGCLAIGDKAIDQLFFLTHKVGLHNVKLIIAPNDLRRSRPATNYFAQPRWLPELYDEIEEALSPFRLSQRFV